MKHKIIFVIKFVIALLVIKVISGGLRVLAGILEGQHGAPSFVTPGFLTFSTIFSILFIVAYYLLGKYIPVHKHIVRGLTFAGLFWSADYFPQVMGMTGGESTILDSATMSLLTIVVDSIGYFLKGMVLGHYIVPKYHIEKKACTHRAYLSACLSSMILFPALLGVCEFILGHICDAMYCINAFGIKEETYLFFYIIFYLFQLMSGLVMPIFYRWTEYNRESPLWVRFASVFGILLWLPVVLIVMFFGIDPIVTIVWGTMMVVVIYADTFIFAKIIK